MAEVSVYGPPLTPGYTVLSLGYNEIDDSGASGIAGALKVNETLQALRYVVHGFDSHHSDRNCP